ncbi:MAG TPA: hypothetical protein VMV46_15035 [Thermoanaerobaculia bacterium]|nr:hypothetical protein [Thermoanaerobaculia bacterium]
MSEHTEREDRPEEESPDTGSGDAGRTADDELEGVAGGRFSTFDGDVLNTADYGDSPAGFTVTIQPRFDKLIR